MHSDLRQKGGCESQRAEGGDGYSFVAGLSCHRSTEKSTTARVKIFLDRAGATCHRWRVAGRRPLYG